MSRLGIISMVVLLVTGCSQTSHHPIPGQSNMRDEVMKIITQAPAGAMVAVAFEDLQTGRQLLINETVQMHAASTMKVPVMIEVFKQAEAGRFELNDSITVVNEFRSIVDGSPYSMDIDRDGDSASYAMIGRKMTLYELTDKMITVSSNIATNNLIQLVEAENVMATLADLGITDMQVLRGVEDIKAYEAGLSNSTNAIDMLRVMLAIGRDEAVSPSACRMMRGILFDQQFRDKIPAGLPAGVQVGNKTGSITRISHDAALVYPPDGRAYGLVVLTRGIEDQGEATALIARISRAVYRTVQRRFRG